jgi:hypothetical protein
MANRQEVQVRTGALTEGTRHRGDKGVELGHQSLCQGAAPGGPARGRLVEVIGARRDPNGVKRRKASTSGRLASSSESPKSVGDVGVVATGRREVCWILPSEICRIPHSGSP